METRTNSFLYIGLLFLLLLKMSTSIAQVTIGSIEKPAKAALLDLKENNELGENSSKGMLLPRVKLTKMIPDNAKELAESIGNENESYDLESHTGLMVYNVNKDICVGILDGLHIWSGTQWQYLGEEEKLSNGAYIFTDSRDNEVYIARNFGPIAGDWMLENLRYNPKLFPDIDNGFDGSTFQEGILSTITTKAFYYSIGALYVPSGTGAPSNWEKYKQNGLLYTFPAAVNAEKAIVPNASINEGEQPNGTDPTTQIQGICPKGWHLPSDKEWNDLEKVIYEHAEEYSTFTSGIGPWFQAWNSGLTGTGYGLRPSAGNNNHGKVMKSPCPIYGTVGITRGESYQAKQGGFAVVLAGSANDNRVANYGSGAYFYSSSINSVVDTQGAAVNGVFTRDFVSFASGVSRLVNINYGMLSVRCKKNN